MSFSSHLWFYNAVKPHFTSATGQETSTAKSDFQSQQLSLHVKYIATRYIVLLWLKIQSLLGPGIERSDVVGKKKKRNNVLRSDSFQHTSESCQPLPNPQREKKHFLSDPPRNSASHQSSHTKWCLCIQNAAIYKQHHHKQHMNTAISHPACTLNVDLDYLFKTEGEYIKLISFLLKKCSRAIFHSLSSKTIFQVTFKTYKEVPTR